MPPLKNPKWERYAQGLTSGLEQLQAYKAAGYKGKSPGSASKLANRSEVAGRVAELLEMAADEAGVSAQDVIEELKRIAFSDMGQYSNWGAHGVVLRSSLDLDEDAARCVAEVSQTVSETGGSLKFKLHDKLKALELLGRHLGVFAKDNEQGPSERAIVIMYPENGRDK